MSTSTGSLTEVLDRNSPVRILPLRVPLAGQPLTDGIEIDNHEYCLWRQKHLDDTVATAPPPEDLLRNTFTYLIKQGYRQVIITTLSHKLSDSADTIRALEADFPKLEIYVVDTGSCCMPEGFFALDAVRLLQEGKTPQEAVTYLERLKPNSHIVFGLRSMQSLSLNGTLSRLGARFSDWLGLRTILHFSKDNLSRLGTVGDDEEMFESVIVYTQNSWRASRLRISCWQVCTAAIRKLICNLPTVSTKKTGLRLGDGVPVSPAVAVHVGIHGVGVGLVEKLKD